KDKMKSLLLCLKFYTIGLHCNVCYHAHGSDCLAGKDTCLASEDESCSTISYYKGGKHLFSKHMCRPECKEQQFINEDELTVVMCCEKNLCNVF
uniref:UPAR/Ly6 domain-containing protein n=1 Tax=Castor canadensis TaxID=51338 RepID=A0A8C0WDC9_CASCN